MLPFKVTFAILLDGLRYGCINPTDAPFLWSLQQEGIWGAVVETFAFQTRPAFFAGLWPEECDICHLFWYDPDSSPYHFTRYLPLPDWTLRVPKLRGLILHGLRYLARYNERCRGHSASAAYAHPAQIPFRLLRYFAYSERYLTWQANALPKPTVFDVLRQYGLSWLWLGYPEHDQHTQALLHSFQQQIQPEHRFVYLHFAELDWNGHRYGPESCQYRKALKELDTAVEVVYRHLSSMFDEVNGVIFGDHGMVSIQRLVDVDAALRKTDLRVPRDYVYFLDSTQARFWFQHESARRITEKALASLEGGRILREEDHKHLHIRFHHDRFGQLIFVADGHTLIFPNFFQHLSSAQGMHGYLPDVQDNWAHCVVVDSASGAGHRELPRPVEMVDLFPTFLELLQLPIPMGTHARSILQQALASTVQGND
jgi:hypothetical protein